MSAFGLNGVAPRGMQFEGWSSLGDESSAQPLFTHPARLSHAVNVRIRAVRWESLRAAIGVVSLGGDAIRDTEALYDD